MSGPADRHRLYLQLRRIVRAFFSFYFRLEVEGLEHLPAKGPVLVCANHLSWWDPPLIGSVIDRPICFMAKAELFRLPLLGWLLPRVGSFPVRRGTADRATIRRALEALQNGEVVALFPEGRRMRPGDQAPAYPGAVLLAVRSGAPVVPVGIQGRYRPFHRIRVRIGKPLRPEGWKAEMPLRSPELRRISNDVIMAEIRRLQA